MDAQGRRGRGRKAFWSVVIFLPAVAVLWVPFFNFALPSLFGVPFFYWYQLLWVLISAALTLAAHMATD
jgi:hypothetical protein